MEEMFVSFSCHMYEDKEVLTFGGVNFKCLDRAV